MFIFFTNSCLYIFCPTHPIHPIHYTHPIRNTHSIDPLTPFGHWPQRANALSNPQGAICHIHLSVHMSICMYIHFYSRPLSPCCPTDATDCPLRIPWGISPKGPMLYEILKGQSVTSIHHICLSICSYVHTYACTSCPHVALWMQLRIAWGNGPKEPMPYKIFEGQSVAYVHLCICPSVCMGVPHMMPYGCDRGFHWVLAPSPIFLNPFHPGHKGINAYNCFLQSATRFTPFLH
jgi:hypothetical protein